jgi:hypothetical protein
MASRASLKERESAGLILCSSERVMLAGRGCGRVVDLGYTAQAVYRD